MIRSLLLFSLAMAYTSVCAAQTPKHLVWDGTADDGKTALAIMKQDPSWVTRRDTKRCEYFLTIRRKPLLNIGSFANRLVFGGAAASGYVDAYRSLHFRFGMQYNDPAVDQLIAAF